MNFAVPGLFLNQTKLLLSLSLDCSSTEGEHFSCRTFFPDFRRFLDPYVSNNFVPFNVKEKKSYHTGTLYIYRSVSFGIMERNTYEKLRPMITGNRKPDFILTYSILHIDHYLACRFMTYYNKLFADFQYNKELFKVY